ncbi:MAG TPA: tetratricopeptide repeat protein [Candidatus Thermoplasmatota archaeon]
MGPHRPRIIQSALYFALAAMLVAPLANADLAAANTVVDKLVGECDSDLLFVPLQTRLFFHDKASIPISTFLTGTSLRIERAEGTDAHVSRGPLGSGYLYSNYRSDVVETFEHDSFQLDLLDFLADSSVIAMSEVAIQPTWATATAPNGFEVLAPVAEIVEYGDPRDAYQTEPVALRLLAGVTDLTIVGDMRFLIEQTEFRVRTETTTDVYRAENTRASGDETAEQVQYFILHVTDARLATTDSPVSAWVYADVLNIDCVGTIFDATPSPSTPAGEISQPVPIATGDLDVSPRRDGDQIMVQFTVDETSDAVPEAANIGIAQSAFPYWGFIVALGVVATGGGVAAWRFHRKHPELPEARSVAVPEAAPVPKRGPRTTQELEQAYRKDPANTVVALELGLAYAKQNKPHDALPLLQLAIEQYPKMDAARYFAGIALLEIGRIDDGLRHLAYAFRLNALNVARFINEGAALTHGQNPLVRAMLARWSRQFQESNARGYV